MYPEGLSLKILSLEECFKNPPQKSKYKFENLVKKTNHLTSSVNWKQVNQLGDEMEESCSPRKFPAKGPEFNPHL